jgi:hypothetical protein
MNPPQTTSPSQSTARGSAALWLVSVCSIISIAAALVPCASLFARRSPIGLVVAAGLAAFPLVPLFWHALAEARASARAAAPFNGRIRFALRSLAVAGVVLAVSLGNLGPKRSLAQVRALIAPQRVHTAVKGKDLPPPMTPFGLEPFIPADASLAVGLSGSAAMQLLFATQGVDIREKLTALATCKIDFANARVLIASRGTGSHLIVVRAPGIAEDRNLYCLVGVMGEGRVQVASDGSQGSKVLHVKGWSSQPLTFRMLDEMTMIATDQAWQATAAKKLLASDGETPPGPLAAPLGRVQVATPLWIAGVNVTAQGTWDLAVDTRQEGNTLKLQGSATPPAGESDRAQISVTVPLPFAAALPESAVTVAIRGVMTALAAAAASPP